MFRIPCRLINDPRPTEVCGMKTFLSDGIELAFYDEGAGIPILLIHGFASSARVNWFETGWVSFLNHAGYRVIAIDNRGHGGSKKLYAPALYRAPLMAEDARRLLDHLGLDHAHVMGYSMGARITAFLGLNHPDRVRTAIFGGLGSGMVDGVGDAEPIARALEAERPEDVNHAVGRAFRVFADQTGSDRMALAACMRAVRQKISAEDLAGIVVPVLVAVGTRDVIAGSAERLAAMIPGAEVLDIPRRDHMRAVGDKVYKDGVLDFLGRQR